MIRRTALVSLLLTALCGCSGDDPGVVGSGGGGRDGGSGAAGAGGEGGSVETVCEPGEVRSCYGGEPGTEDVGLCRAGTETCRVDGAGWAPCADEVVPVEEVCSALGDEDCDGIACSETSWSLAITGSATINTSRVAVDAEGNTFVAATWRKGAIGFANASWSTAGNERRMLVAKLDPHGVPLWSEVTAGGASIRTATSLAVDPDGNLVIAGSYEGDFAYGSTTLPNAGDEADVFVMKIDGQGDVLWSRHLAAHQATQPLTSGPVGWKTVADIAVDENGQIFIGGIFTGHWGGPCILNGCPTPYPDETAWLTKLDAAGGMAWWREISGAGNDAILALDPVAGGVVAGGGFEGSITIGPDTYNSASGGFSGWIARYDAAGAVLWSKFLFDPTGSYVTGVAASSSRIVVAGAYVDGNPLGAPNAVGDSDLFVAELDLDGVPSWVTSHGGPGAIVDEPRIAEGSDGGIVLSAYFKGDITVAGEVLESGDQDIFSYAPLVIAHDAEGNTRWARALLSTATDLNVALDIDVAPNRELVVVGRYAQPFDIGDQLLPFEAESDVFVARLQP